VVGHEHDVGSALHDLSVGDRVDVVDLGGKCKAWVTRILVRPSGVTHEHPLEHRPADVGIQSGEGKPEGILSISHRKGAKRYSHRRSEHRHHSRWLGKR
jgi:hypothetical protein